MNSFDTQSRAAVGYHIDRLLISYFRSGWAFLIPYLAAYLLYAWLKWPVNPEGTVKVMPDVTVVQPSTPSFLHSLIPSLLYVYWLLHTVHLLLAGLTLRIWWRNVKPSAPNLQVSAFPAALWPLLPWLCLALIFWIPGVYLEWPSDPWEHLRRINEWSSVEIVTAHSAWMKSSYFIPYSLLNWAIGLRQIFWLDFYYTGICVLLCWQYYRLARACDLGECASMMFVILQALVLGNNIFSFYRYYGISSSIYAQLGAVALTRFAIEAAHSKHVLASRPFVNRSPASDTSPPTVYQLVLAGCLLLPLIAFNHAQALGFVALGLGAIAVWQLIARTPAALWWLIGVTFVANTLFVWWYPRPAMIETCRSIGLLNAWYGLNILDLTSPAGERMIQIVNVFGLFNLAAAFFLLRRNRVIAWLTILPFVILLLPSIAVPLSQFLAMHGGDIAKIVIFQRTLFSIPQCLALTCLAAQLLANDRMAKSALSSPRFPNTAFPDSSTSTDLAYSSIHGHGFLPLAIATISLCVFMILPGSSQTYNRLWNAYATVPSDLRLRDFFLSYETIQRHLPGSTETKVVTTQVGTALLASSSMELIGPSQYRRIGLSATESIATALDFLHSLGNEPQKDGVTADKTEQNSHLLQRVNLIADAHAADSSAWLVLSGHAPQFITGIADFPASSTALRNPTGTPSGVFTSALIPIHALKSYHLEMSVKQVRDAGGTIYLAVVWYDAERNVLVSNIPTPRGAGNPRGWVNGTYSYFGLFEQTPPTSWTKYAIAFGLGESAAIPPQARFVRVGALLNYTAKPSAVIQLTGVRMVEKTTPTIGLILPKATCAFSPLSQAALLSGHWPPQQVMTDRAGTIEIMVSASTATRVITE